MFLYKVLLPLALKNSFTYSSDEKIQNGTRVLVNLKGKEKIGIVWENIQEVPDYEIKPIIKILDSQPVLNEEIMKTIEFISFYYITFKGLVLKSSLPKKFFEITDEIDLEKEENQVLDINVVKLYKLNEEQEYIYNSIDKNSFNVNLIFGVTGSGKTEIYLNLIENIIQAGKQAVVLVPEIALTPQYIEIFAERFPNIETSIIHSRLTPKKKFQNWNSFLKNRSKILIGTRSSVMLDFSNTGIIIVDEENDESYKQENEPRYNAKDIAIYRAKNYNIPVVLCSATPTIESLYKAKTGKFKLFRLSKRIKNIPMPKIEIIENRYDEIFAQETIDEIKKTINKQETVAVLINRRGFSNYMVCKECGYLFLCPNCSVSLTYHKETNDLKCHWCEENFEIPKKCPKCGSYNIVAKGTGSQKVEEELKNIFQDKIIERFDRDSVTTKKEFERIIDSLRSGKTDIIIGTQMISKGHDISKIGLAVITNIDSLISIPDFRAEEKTLSLIIQTAGRSGRQKQGKVIIQTLSSKNKLLSYAKKHDYEAFYDNEIKNRKIFNYPPFSHLIRIIVESTNREKSKNCANEIFTAIENDFNILGPSKCPIYKIKNRYRYHILIKTSDIIKSIDRLREKVKSCKEKVHFDVDPINFF